MAEMSIGEVNVQFDNGEVRNAFCNVELGSGLQVVVPSLVVITGDEVNPIYDLTIQQRKNKAAQNIRVLAHCLNDECEQLHLIDSRGRLATEYFRPTVGHKLGTDKLPGVHVHTFGILGLAFDNVPDLLEEARSYPKAGRIMQHPVTTTASK